MAGDGGRRNVLAAVAFVLVVVFGAGFVYLSNQEGEAVFCELALAGFDRGGEMVALEDQNDPGPDDCDGSKVLRGMDVLGFDCKVRDPDGDVVDELEPNQPDGRCGQSVDGSPFPESWQTA